MDSKPSGQGSSLDSLRTVEFRQTLRGYHIDDVDEYLERVAVDAEALQEQLRQAGDRLKQAAERIAQLETMVQELQSQPAAASGPAVSDDTLQRTLLMAQRFVDQTHAEAEAQARTVVSEAEDRARQILGDAEQRAKSVTEDTERHLREDIARLESVRTQLASDVEGISRHLENERNRLRGALSDMLTWVDEHVQPATSVLGQRMSRSGAAPDPSPVRPSSEGSSGPDPSGVSIEGGGRSAVPVQGNAATGGAHAVDPDSPPAVTDRQGPLPLDTSSQPRVISPR